MDVDRYLPWSFYQIIHMTGTCTLIPTLELNVNRCLYPFSGFGHFEQHQNRHHLFIVVPPINTKCLSKPLQEFRRLRENSFIHRYEQRTEVTFLVLKSALRWQQHKSSQNVSRYCGGIDLLER